jgi:pyrroloquinoline quinone biosynthesis protein B
MMRILVLGAAAGGGVPQWNCNCGICREARRGGNGVARAAQASVAVSADGDNWFLINASPDLRQQVVDNPQLHPRHGLRHSPIAGVLLTNGDVDAIAGLLTMREGAPFTLYAHDNVLAILRANSIFNVLSPLNVKRLPIALETPFDLTLPDGRASGLRVTAFAVPGKVPLYLEGGAPDPGAVDTIGLLVENGDSRFFFVAACAEMTPELARRLADAPMVFFDGTLWQDDEMIKGGLGAKTGRRMAHLSMAGERGSIESFRSIPVGRKIYLHINNSNPAWLPDSPERRQLAQAGWEILPDGTEISL